MKISAMSRARAIVGSCTVNMNSPSTRMSRSAKYARFHLTDEEQRWIVLPRKMLFGQTQHVVIVRTGQSLVARDNDVAGLAALDLEYLSK